MHNSSFVTEILTQIPVSTFLVLFQKYDFTVTTATTWCNILFCTVTNRKEKDTESKYKFFKSKDKSKSEVDSLKANTESIEKIKHLIATSGDHLFSEADVSVKK